MSVGSLSVTGGSFTSTSGTLTDIGNWTVIGGTFNHNSGTVQFFNNNTQSLTLTGSHTLNNVTIGGNLYLDTLTIAGGTTLTVNGTLNFAGSFAVCCPGPIAVNSGAIAATGNVIQGTVVATG